MQRLRAPTGPCVAGQRDVISRQLLDLKNRNDHSEPRKQEPEGRRVPKGHGSAAGREPRRRFYVSFMAGGQSTDAPAPRGLALWLWGWDHARALTAPSEHVLGVGDQAAPLSRVGLLPGS